MGFNILSTATSTILLDDGTEKENCLVLRLEGMASALSQFTEGNQISFKWSNNFDLCCNVLKLVECTDVYTDIAIDTIPHNFDASKATSGSLWIPSNPEIGNIQLGTAAHAEGYATKAVQLASHTEGYNTIAAGRYAHAEGNSTIAVYAAHAEGNSTKALGQESHAEGHGTNATGIGAHSEGGATVAEGKYSHAEGENTQATGYRAHTEGFKTKASGKGAHAEGFTTEAQGENSHAEGWETKALGMASHAEGISTTAEVLYSHAEGNGTNAKGQSSHTEGVSTTATSIASHAEGSSTTAGAASAHAEGDGSKALGIGSHAEGLGTEAQGNYSHSEGRSSKAIGVNSHSEGNSTESNGVSSHAEGNYAKSKGKASHAEGNYATASGESSHAEGSYTNASGTYSHAEGNNTQATGAASHAEGYRSKAKADYAHAAGEYSEATVQSQYVVGKYNKINNDAMFIVGNGETTDTRSNAFEVYKDGHAEIQTMGTTDNSVVTKKYVDDELSKIELIKIVNVLPEIGLSNFIYLISKTDTQNEDVYDEYLWINKGTESNPIYDWEWIGSKQINVDLTDYVKNTDYATSNKAGVMKVGTGLVEWGGGVVQLYPALEREIDGKAAIKAITPQFLDYAVKVGVTTNTIQLTEDEKAKACEWVGVDNLAIRKAVSGDNSLTVNDVSPFAHKCSLKLTSEKSISDSKNIYKFDSSNILDLPNTPNEHTNVTCEIKSNGTVEYEGQC